MTTINFLPPSYATAQGHRLRRFRLVLLLALAAVGVGAWYLLVGRELGELDRCARAKVQAQDAMQQRLTQIQTLRTRCESLNHLVQTQRSLAAPLTNTQVLATLGRLVPPRVTLTEVTMISPAPAVDGGHDPGSMRLTLMGLAPADAELATLVERLARHPLFDRVNLEFSKAMSVGEVQARQFLITCQVPLDRDYKALRGQGVADAH
jgi:Tfp pilus assembly protein PilN